MKNNKKTYFTPALEFLAIEPKTDILSLSDEVERDEHSPDYGVVFPM